MISLDTETKLIGPGAVAPDIICASLYDGSAATLVGNDNKQYLEEILTEVFTSGHVVGQFIAYDLTVIVEAFPNLLPIIIKALDQRNIHDIRIREKLINLGSHGFCDFKDLPDGSQAKITYRLVDLEKKYLGIDREEDKRGKEDIWRLNYSLLDGKPAESYPKGAYDYAIEDAESPHKIFEIQQAAHGDLLKTEWLRVQSDFVLRCITCVGIKIDPARVNEVEREIQIAVDATSPALIAAGILRPPVAARPKKTGSGMMAAKASTLNRKVLCALVAESYSKLGQEPRLTATGAISADAAAITELAEHNEVLSIYQERQKVNKILTTYIPAMKWEGEIAERVHPAFDVLKDSGRISSYANRSFPSCNIQNVDPRVRGCFIADDGFVILSADYSALELCSTAWKTKQVCGNSRMLDLLKRGIDLHAYLGSVLAHFLDRDFGAATNDLTDEQRYTAFQSLKETNKDFYKHYRTFAKPTGLGYIGGLGPKTFITYAKTTYGVDIRRIAETIESIPEVAYNHEGDRAIWLAAYIKEIWLNTFPEMREYFTWVGEQATGEDKYSYESPLGMVRNGGSFCATANGAAMQSPSAEGFLLALWEVFKAGFDETSDLYGSILLAPIHDEILIEVPEDRRDGAAEELRQVMQKCMAGILEEVPIKVEVAMMYRWNKAAEEQHDEQGRWVVN